MRTSKLGDEPVMLCVRVPPSLRRRIKLAAVQSGQPVQKLAAEALETQCQHHGV
jgi:predicted HicB family RNase H-like nuclease